MKEPLRSKKPFFFSKIDVIIILVVLSIFLSVGVVIKTVLQKDTFINVELLAAGGEWWWGVPPPYYWNLSALHKGAKELDVTGTPLVEILDINKQGWDNRKYVLIKARIKVKKNTRTNTYLFRQTQVQIGKTITIAPDNIAIIANVVGIEGVGQIGEKENVIITAKILEQRPWRVDEIEVGDKMVNDKGEVVAEIIDKQIEPSLMVTTTWQGETLLKADPYYKDVTLKLKAVLLKDGDQVYFNYFQFVQKGSELSIQFTKTSVSMNVVSIEPVK